MSSLVLEVRLLWHHTRVVLAAQDQRLLGILAAKWDTESRLQVWTWSCGRAGSSSLLHSSIYPAEEGTWCCTTWISFLELKGPKHNYQRAGERRMLYMGGERCRTWCIWANSWTQGTVLMSSLLPEEAWCCFQARSRNTTQRWKGPGGGEELWSQRKWAKNEKKPNV